MADLEASNGVVHLLTKWSCLMEFTSGSTPAHNFFYHCGEFSGLDGAFGAIAGTIFTQTDGAIGVYGRE